MSLIGQQVFVAPGQVFSTISGGGGGGSVGPNPSVSTITINPTGEILLAATGSQNASVVGLTNTTAGTQSTTSFSVAFPAGYVSPGAGAGTGCWTVESQDQFNGSYYGDLCAGRFICAGNNSGTNAELPWITAGLASDMTIHAASSINLQTSSVLVNGTPLSGGSVAPGANLPGLSTIGVSSIAGGVSIVSGPGAPQGLNMGNGVIALDTPSTEYQANLYYNASDSNTYLVGLSTHTTRIGTQANPAAIQVGDTGLYTTNIFGLSTINGNQPTGKSSYQVSTLTGTTTYVPANNVAWPLSGDIPTQVGHLYRISGVVAVQNGGSGNTSFLISGGGAGFPSAFAAYENLAAIPGNGGYAAGIQTIFKPQSGSAVQVIAYNTDAITSTTLDFYYPNWLVEDLGTNL